MAPLLKKRSASSINGASAAAVVASRARPPCQQPGACHDLDDSWDKRESDDDDNEEDTWKQEIDTDEGDENACPGDVACNDLNSLNTVSNPPRSGLSHPSLSLGMIGGKGAPPGRVGSLWGKGRGRPALPPSNPGAQFKVSRDGQKVWSIYRIAIHAWTTWSIIASGYLLVTWSVININIVAP